MYKKKMLPVTLALSFLMLLSSCGQSASEGASEGVMIDDIPYVGQVQVEFDDETKIEDEPAILAQSPSVPNSVLKPLASGTEVKENEKAVIDYSNIADGYVMAKFTASTKKKLKAQVTGPTTTYTYNLDQGKWATFPLSDGNGNYKVSVYENVSGNKYSTVLSVSFKVKLTDQFAPFLRPNQYVNYENAPKTIKKAAGLVSKKDNELTKVKKIYNYVVKNLKYDTQKAKTVQSGYLPDLDKVLAKKKGICFDYAALMTGMLRSQGVPCKLVVGYAGSAYHAWISVWSEDTGWIDGAIYFDGTSWQRMDPTFVSSAKNSASIKKFVGDGSNYSPKYLY